MTINTKKVYLTIDDAPSDNFLEKISYLKEMSVPAVFFCIGSKIEEHFEDVVQALNDGFLLGNHSYSHARFSHLPLRQIKREILKTEKLIEQAYLSTTLDRPFKLFRFPYGDNGFNINNKYFYFLPWRIRFRLASLKTKRIQKCLRVLGFEQPSYPFNLSPIYRHTGHILGEDMSWTFDSYDYKYRELDKFSDWLENGSYEKRNNLGPIFRNRLLEPNQSDIFLMHDYDDNFFHLKEVVEFFKNKHIEMTSFV